MKIQGSVETVYGLAAVFLIVTVFFLMGKGSSFNAGHNTLRETRFEPEKLGKALGGCFAVLTIVLGVTSALWNFLPAWYGYLFFTVIGLDMLAVMMICHANIIFRK